MARILHYWLPVVAWAALITFFSTDAFHEETTEGILRSVLVYFLPSISQDKIELVNAGVRKTAHVGSSTAFLRCFSTALFAKMLALDTIGGGPYLHSWWLWDLRGSTSFTKYSSRGGLGQSSMWELI